MILYTSKSRIPFQIDEADHDAVSYYSWHIDSAGYPNTDAGKRPTIRKIHLHLFLLGRAPEGLEIDHINRDKLDNRRANLRFVTDTVNNRNTGIPANNTSGVKGVVWHRQTRKWQAQIKIPGRHIYIGLFNSLEAATAARLAAEAKLWGSDR